MSSLHHGSKDYFFLAIIGHRRKKQLSDSTTFGWDSFRFGYVTSGVKTAIEAPHRMPDNAWLDIAHALQAEFSGEETAPPK